MKQPEICYVRPEDVTGDVLWLQKAEAHHLVHVLRKRARDPFVAVDGLGTAYACEIARPTKDGLEARIMRKSYGMGEPAFCLTLALAVPKPDRLEWAVEKGTELGIAGIVPLLTQRTVLPAQRVKAGRLHKVSVAAMKQCRRSRLPVIESPRSLAEVCARATDADLKLIAHEKETRRSIEGVISALRRDGGTTTVTAGILCIGPEGGFTAEEVAMAEAHGFMAVTLGCRRLRVETAAVAATALVMEKMGELG
ncbi:MAG: 16S rRNA (uracil(1498)-N(3))-methyltransferase [Calditrichaeota bacterium]|nr:MAG: 16S rRNA (uracil(1498)-N(3))-methyltransferase [Calditrichota bacterium]